MHLFDWLARRNARKTDQLFFLDILCLEAQIEEFGLDLIVFGVEPHLDDMEDLVFRIGLHIELQFLRLLGLDLEVVFKVHLLGHYLRFYSLRIDEDGHESKLNAFFVGKRIEEAVDDEGLVSVDDAVAERAPFDAFVLGKRLLKGKAGSLVLLIH